MARSNSPAFPTSAYDGMTLRQWYKGMAISAAMQLVLEAEVGSGPGQATAMIIQACAEIADALIAEDGA